MKCLEKDRARRYETANGLAMDIQRHLNTEPVLARPPSVVYRLRKAVRRHKAAFTAAATVMATLIVGLGLSLWQAMVIDHERDRAVASEREAISQAEVADRERARAEELERTARRRAYAADMHLVQRALELNDLGRAVRLLDRYRPEAGEEDLRGWEWRYLWKQVQPDALYSLPAVEAPVFSLAAWPRAPTIWIP
jgi:eukaryotic-like serine/threonine-protein kinase